MPEEKLMPIPPPDYEFLAVNFLTANVTREMPDVLVNLYSPDKYPVPRELPPTHRVVIHGHKRSNVCSTPDFCHELGYLPNDRAVNKKHFYMRWPTLRPDTDTNEQESPPVGVQPSGFSFGDSGPLSPPDDSYRATLTFNFKKE